MSNSSRLVHPEYIDRVNRRLDFINPEYRAHYVQQNTDIFSYRLNPVKYTQCRKCTTNNSCYLSTYSPAAGSRFENHRS